jgi:hypothetical protein
MKMTFGVSIDKGKKTLTIQLPLEKPRVSASGKTLLLATTHGLATGEATYSGRPIVVAASAFVYPAKQANSAKGDGSGSAPSDRGKEGM